MRCAQNAKPAPLPGQHKRPNCYLEVLHLGRNVALKDISLRDRREIAHNSQANFQILERRELFVICRSGDQLDRSAWLSEKGYATVEFKRLAQSATGSRSSDKTESDELER